jgi:hypothetical protein
MPIIVYCKSCAKKIRVPDGPAGRKGKCPQCNATLLIPAESETAPPEIATKTPREALEPVAEEKAPPAKPSQPEPEPVKTEPEKPKEPKPTAKPAPAAAPAKKKAARIALQMDPTDAEDPLKAKRVALEAAKKEEEKAKDPGATTEDIPKTTLKPVAKPGPRNLKQINWAEEPEPVKKTNPLLWVLIGLIVIGLSIVAWKFLTKPDPNRLSPEERKRQQFQIEPGADGWKDLRGGSKPK